MFLILISFLVGIGWWWLSGELGARKAETGPRSIGIGVAFAILFFVLNILGKWWAMLGWGLVVLTGYMVYKNWLRLNVGHNENASSK